MMLRAWSSIVEVPYCFSRSYVKFQGHMALQIVEFDPNWAFPDCNSSLNSPMAMKCCTKLDTAKERSPIVFQGHPSNFKVTRYKISPILTQIGRFRTIGRSQLSNPSDLPCSANFVKCSLISTCSIIPDTRVYMPKCLHQIYRGHSNIGWSCENFCQAQNFYYLCKCIVSCWSLSVYLFHRSQCQVVNTGRLYGEGFPHPVA